jgi:hypothetical protein
VSCKASQLCRLTGSSSTKGQSCQDINCVIETRLAPPHLVKTKRPSYVVHSNHAPTHPHQALKTLKLARMTSTTHHSIPSPNPFLFLPSPSSPNLRTHAWADSLQRLVRTNVLAVGVTYALYMIGQEWRLSTPPRQKACWAILEE